MKFISIYTYDPDTMPDEPDMEKFAKMGALIEEMRKVGVLLDTGGTSPTGVSMRVRRTGSEITATDGPFTETKELIGGFAMLNVASKAEALAWCKRFLAVAGDGQSELHEVSEGP